MTRPRAIWLLPGALAALPAYHAVYAVQYMSVGEAQHAAFADATEFAPVAIDRAALDAALAAVPESALGSDWSPKIWQARKGDAALGWLIVDQVIGKAEAITYALALDPHGAVRSLEVLEYRETHGSEIRLPAWRKQFVGKATQDPVRLDADIHNISGATLSCRHVTDGVRRLLALHAKALKTT
jgi:Na+-translocating ferredoxin:NAD+ oxidoreductase RnfG subunit